jgi:hypothetical protein
MPCDAPAVDCDCARPLGRAALLEIEVAQFRDRHRVPIASPFGDRILAVRNRVEVLAREVARLIGGELTVSTDATLAGCCAIARTIA